MITKYFYFGEFGFFNMYVLAALERFLNRYPESEDKLEIATYKNYGEVINLLFPKIKITTIDYNFYEPNRQAHHYLDENFEKYIISLGFPDNFCRIFRQNEMAEMDFMFGQLPQRTVFLSRPLMYGAPSNEKYISIFPRYRCGELHYGRNISEETWNVLLKIIRKFNYKIVSHGANEEFLKLQGEYIYPKNIFEQIYYLNNSIVSISPNSGFCQFASNCGTDQVIIGDYFLFNPFGKEMVKLYDSCLLETLIKHFIQLNG